MYPKTTSLLSSMAMRYNHGFGLMEEQEQQVLMKKMEDFYNACIVGLNNNELSAKFNYSLVTVKQIKEEIEGKGFYKPDLETSTINHLASPSTNNNLNKEGFYPKTKELLTSMAIRYNHAFGIAEFEMQQDLLKLMNELYECIIAGLSDNKIAVDFEINEVLIKQVREETEGTGFYSPNKKEFYQSFLRL